MKNYWSMFKDWALWLASPTLGVSLFMSPSLLLSFLQLLVKTAHGNDATNPLIYNIIRWFAGPMGQTTSRTSVWRLKYFFFFIIFYRLRALKTIYFHFCNFIKKYIDSVFAKNFARFYEKKKYSEHQTLGWQNVCPIRPANQRIIF